MGINSFLGPDSHKTRLLQSDLTLHQRDRNLFSLLLSNGGEQRQQRGDILVATIVNVDTRLQEDFQSR